MSVMHKISIKIPNFYLNYTLEQTITREEYDKILEGYFQRVCYQPIKDLLDANGIKMKPIRGIVAIGGGAKIIKITSGIEAIYNRIVITTLDAAFIKAYSACAHYLP